MRHKLLLATHNQHKVRELQGLLADTGIEVVSLEAYPPMELEESGETFEENAVMKACAAAKATGVWCLADDSGLEVDALMGAPGVYSARYSGPDATDEANNALLLKRMAGVPEEKRGARFVSAVALCSPSGECVVRRGECEGVVGFGLKGDGGFGYDPLFWVPEEQATYAEIPFETKNRISHRARAFRAIKADIIERLKPS